jgi:hypothetical protein
MIAEAATEISTRLENISERVQHSEDSLSESMLTPDV